MILYHSPNHEVNRLFDLMFYFRDKWPQQPMLACKKRGEWIEYKAGQVIEESMGLAQLLLKAGIQPGDRIGIIAPNSPEWFITDYAIQMIGAVSVPVYPSLTPSELLQIFSHSGVRIVFTGNDALTQKTEGIRAQLDQLEFIIPIHKSIVEGEWENFIQSVKSPEIEQIYARIDGVKEHQLATIIYTSGTTGIPKGVMLTHANIISNFKSNAPHLPIEPGGRALSFLPLCHIYERMCSSLFLHEGLSIWFAEGLEKISENIQEVKPHIFATVPRLLEKVYDKILLKGLKLSGVKRMMFDWSLKVGHSFDFNHLQNPLYSLQLAIVRKMVFSKWREALGGNVKGIVSGGSALQPRLARIFWAAGIPVVEGYGLSETSPVIAVNYFTAETCRFGTVGKVIQGCTVKILKESPEDKTGEILAKSPGLMIGYYNDTEQTEAVINSDGWFHTGDIGYIDSDGFLKITDRKKEIFKNSGGKYIAPQPIENKLKESMFIQNVMIVGENQDHPAALIVPEIENIRMHLSQAGKPLPTKGKEHESEAVRKVIYEEIKKFNPYFSPAEKVHGFCLLSNEWTQDGGELTPTQKLKRKFIANKYAQEIERLFQS